MLTLCNDLPNFYFQVYPLIDLIFNFQIEPYMNDFFLATAFIKMGVSPVGIRTAKKLRGKDVKL